MKFTILLEEMDNERVLDVVLKYFPKARLKYTSTKSNPNKYEYRFFLYPKNGGSYTKNSVIGHIKIIKLEKISNWLKTKSNVSDVYISQTSLSLYFMYEGKQYRISDHNNNKFEGTKIFIDFFSDENAVIKRLSEIIN